MYVEKLTFDKTINDIIMQVKTDYEQTNDFINKNFLEIKLINDELKNIKCDVNYLKNDCSAKNMNNDKNNTPEELSNCGLKKYSNEDFTNLDQSHASFKNEKTFNYDNTIRSLSKRLCEIDAIIVELSKNYNSIQKDEDKIRNIN